MVPRIRGKYTGAKSPPCKVTGDRSKLQTFLIHRNPKANLHIF